MALRKPLFLNTGDGVSEEINPTNDSITLGLINLGGIGGVALQAGGNLLSGVATPVSATDAATKAYVDNAQLGLAFKPPVLAMATSNITLSGTQTVDGVSLAAGNRVLVTGQTTASQNGIWVVASGSWTRPTDFATGGSAASSVVWVEKGTVNADTGWTCTNDPGSDVIDTASLAFVQFTGLGQITAGNGLTKSANTISALANGTTIAVAAAGLSVLGVPASFTIAGTATSANVTAANLGTLTAGSGSSADGLHTHSNVNSAVYANQAQAIGNVAVVSSASSAGDPVCWSATNNTLARGDCSADATSRVIGLCNTSASANASVTYIKDGIIVGCLTSAVANTPYFLAAGGGLTTSVPTASGNRVVRVGFAKNATDLYVSISDMGKRA